MATLKQKAIDNWMGRRGMYAPNAGEIPTGPSSSAEINASVNKKKKSKPSASGKMNRPKYGTF